MTDMKKIYKQIAKQNGITVDEVKRDIKEAIDAAYVNPNFYAKCVPCKGEIPTPDEFITYMANRISILEKADK